MSYFINISELLSRSLDHFYNMYVEFNYFHV